jgi:G3E family GTPase
LAFVHLDGVVTVVDALNAPGQLRSHLASTLRTQLDAAHLIVLSKTDLVSDEAVAGLFDELATLVPGRPIIRSSDALACEVLLGCSLRGARVPPQAHAHDIAFHSRDFDADQAFNRRQLEERLSKLPAGIVRIKGWCRLSGQTLVEVQLVGRRWTVQDAACIASNATGLTVIATDEKDLDIAEQLLGSGARTGSKSSASEG